MYIFDKVEGFPSKVNFVDENSVVLGYDLTQNCCEHADWFIADKPTLKVMDNKIFNLDGWVFDVTFFVSGCFNDSEESESNCVGVVIFRITKGDDEKFIHLFNCQNGFYNHGFDFMRQDEVLRDNVIVKEDIVLRDDVI